MADPRLRALFPRMPVLACAAALLLAGCHRPPPEPPEAPPEPQATALRDAVQDPLDKATAVEHAVHEADARRREQADAAD